MDKYTEFLSFNVVLHNHKKKKNLGHKFQNHNIEQMKQNAEWSLWWDIR